MPPLPWGRGRGWGLYANGLGTPPPSLPLKGEEKGVALSARWRADVT